MSLNQILPRARPSLECTTDKEMTLDSSFFKQLYNIHLVRVMKEPRYKEVWVGQTKG